LFEITECVCLDSQFFTYLFYVTRRSIFLYTHKRAFICDCVHMVEEYLLASDSVWA